MNETMNENVEALVNRREKNATVAHRSSARWPRWLFQWVRKASAYLPTAIRHALYRSMVCVPRASSGFEFGVASDRAEVEACLELVHEVYVESGFMLEHPSGLRVTPWHELPTTTILYAKSHGEIIATVTVVGDGLLGLPMQKTFNLSALREAGMVVEISCLAVAKGCRGAGGETLFALMKFLWTYCKCAINARHMAIAVGAERIDLYEALLGFSRLSILPAPNYDFVEGDRVLGTFLDLSTASAVLGKLYTKAPPSRSLALYMSGPDDTGAVFPEPIRSACP